jgi:tetratricopeptide (TPR) repeat protein
MLTKSPSLLFITFFSLCTISLAQDEKGFDENKARRFQFMLEERPEAGPIFDKLYAMYKKAGRLSGLIKLYSTKIGKKDAEPAPYFILGRLHERERELRTAARIYSKGLIKAKDLKFERFFHYRLGIVLADLQRTKEAAKELQLAQKLAKGPELKVSVLEELGRVYALSGQRELAARAWREILLVRKNDFFATTHVATLLAKEKLFKHVDQVFKEAIKTSFAKDPAAVLKLRARQGEIFEASHRYKQAALAYQEVLSRTRSGNWLRKQVKARLRRMYFQLGRAYALIDFYKKQMKERPDDPEPILDLADAYEVMGTQSLAWRLLLNERGAFPSNITIRERLLHLLGGPMLYRRQSTALPLNRTDQTDDPDADPEEQEGNSEEDEQESKTTKGKDLELDSNLDSRLEDLFFEVAEWSKQRILVLEELIALRPSENKYYQALATEYLKNEDHKAAQKVLARLQGLTAGIEGTLLSAKAYVESELFEKALELLAKAAKVAPQDERPQLKMADIFLLLGKKESAIRSLVRACGEASGKSSALGPYSQRRFATLLEERKLLLEAANALAGAVKADDEVASRDEFIKVGQLYQRAEKPISAGQWFLKALEASTNQTDRENVLTSLRESLSDPKHLEWLTHVLANRIEDPKKAPSDIVKTLASVYIDRSRHAEAIKLLENAAGGPPPLGYAARYVSGVKSPETPRTALGQKVPARVLYLRALVPLYSGEKGNPGDILKAFSALRELSRLDPGEHWRYALAEGNAQYRRKHRDEALQIFQMVLQSAPANAPVFSDLARRFGELGDKKSALSAAEKAILQAPRDGKRHWLSLELVKRHLKGDRQQLALLKNYRRFVQSGVNSQDLDQARDDLYELLLNRTEDLAARHKFEEAAACAAESRSLASNSEARARSQLLGAVLKLNSPQALNALEILQGGMGRYGKEWVMVGRTRIRASLLASAWLQRISGQAFEIYQKELAPRGQDLLEVAARQKDKDLLQRLGRLFPFAPQARQTSRNRVARLIKRRLFEEALWVLESLRRTAPKNTPDPHSQDINSWESQCRLELGELKEQFPAALESKPRRSFRTQFSNVRNKRATIKRIDPVLYGQRLFVLQGKDKLLSINLKRLFRRQTVGQPKLLGAARFELGKQTPPSSVVYNLRRPSNYFYYHGTLGVASYPHSLKPEIQSTKDRDIAWKRKVPGLSSMVAMSGRLFVASSFLQALSPRTGQTLWRYGDSQDRSTSNQNGRAAPKALTVLALEVSRSKVYALFSDGECVALDPQTGERIWQSSDLGQFGDGRLKLVSRDKEILLVARGDQIYALLATSGKRLWIGDNITAAASIKNEARKRSKKTPKSSTKQAKIVIKSSPTPYSSRTLNSGPYRARGSSPSTLYKMPPPGTSRINLSYNSGTGRRNPPYGARQVNLKAPEMWITKSLVVLNNHKGSLVGYDLKNGKVICARYYSGAPQHFTVQAETLYVTHGRVSTLEIIDLRKDKLIKEAQTFEVATGKAILVNGQILVPANDKFRAISPQNGQTIYQEVFGGLSELEAIKSTSRPNGSPKKQPVGAINLQKLGPWVAVRGRQFIIVDPVTGKRLFQYPLAAPKVNAQGYAELASLVLTNKNGVALVDNNGAIHLFAGKHK